MDDPTLLSWIERGQNFAALLVALGVAAEFALGFMAGPARHRVDQAKDAEMVRLKKDSASFELDIAKANRGAADALERAAKAEENLGNANKSAADANARAASLELQALQLRKDLALQGSRENLLSGDNRKKLIVALKPFAGQRVDVRYTANAMLVNSAVVTSSPIGDDVVGTANALVSVMRDAGWDLPPTALLYSVQGYGINVELVASSSPSTRRAAKALADALRSVSLEVFGPQIIPLDRAQRTGTAAQALAPLLDENTIVLGVLTHPK